MTLRRHTLFMQGGAIPFVPTDISDGVFWIPIKTGSVTIAGAGISVAADDYNANNFVQGTNADRPALVSAHSLEWGDFDLGNTEYLEAPSAFQAEFRNPFSVIYRLKPDDGQPATLQMIFGAVRAGGTDLVFSNIIQTGVLRFIYGANSNLSIADTNAPVWANGAQADYTTVIITVDASNIII